VQAGCALRRRLLRPRFWLGLAALGFAPWACYAEGHHAAPVDLPPPPEAGAETAVPDSSGPTEAVQFGVFHAAEGQSALSWSLQLSSEQESGVAQESGTVAYAKAARVDAIAPGTWTLDVTIGDQHLSQDVTLAPGSEVNAVVTNDPASDMGWKVDLLTVPGPPDTSGSADASDGSDASDASATALDPTQARLFVLQRSQLKAVDLDVGNDDPSHPEQALDPGATSSLWPLDVTRPALAFLNHGKPAYDFTMPRPAQDSTVIAVVLGDPAADGLGPTGLHLLVARMREDPDVSEVRPDPALYFVHASGAHAGLDLFVSRGIPLAATFSRAAGVGISFKLPAFLPDRSLDVPLNLAQVADNVRFGELRVGRVPPGPATLDLYLTIPGDPQLPAPLNYDLTGTVLLPNQRLRNGGAVGRQGTQTVDGELKAGGEYVLIAPGGDLWSDNRNFHFPLAPAFPFFRLARSPLGAKQFRLRMGASVTRQGDATSRAMNIVLDGSSALVVPLGAPFQLTSDQVLSAGPHQLSLQVDTGAAKSVTLNALAGQDLLLIASGDAAPAPAVIQPKPWRDDDIDGDGAVCSAYSTKAQAFLDPNYLSPDGDSLLIQDDCPEQPGPLSQMGCPAPAVQWLVVDLAARPPTIRAITIE